MDSRAAVAAFWVLTSTPGLALAYAAWQVTKLRPGPEKRITVYITSLAGVDFVFLLSAVANQGLLGPDYSPSRYATLIFCLAISVVLALFAGRLKNQARNSLFLSVSLLAAVWLLNLGLSSVV